jgi:hypothetical protein
MVGGKGEGLTPKKTAVHNMYTVRYSNNLKFCIPVSGLGVDLVSSDGSSDLNMDTDLPRDVDEAVMQVFIRFSSSLQSYKCLEFFPHCG